jgi:chaperonin cofactor prefoldin
MNKPKLTAKEALMQIGNLLKLEFTKVEKFKSAKLKDGTEVMWDGELKEGTAIMVVVDGNQMPAPDAIHETEDGTLVTTVGGLVTAIEAKKEEVEVEMADDTMSKIEERMAACESKMAEMETKMADMFSNYENKFTAIDKTINDSSTSITEKFSAIQSIIETIATEPIVPQPRPNQSSFSKADKKMTALERLAAYKKFVNN